MCKICDGQTPDEFDADFDRIIRDHGWGLMSVEADERSLGWVYTVGLIERFDHPELVTVNLEPEMAAVVLNDLGEAVRAGHRLAPGSVPAGTGVFVELFEVHPRQIEHGVFATWVDRFAWMPEPPVFGALEVVLPDDAYCDDHRGRTPYLCGVDYRLSVGNRAMRRARHRRRHR